MTEKEKMIIIYKIFFLGESCIGKSSIVNKIKDNSFNEEYQPTIGVDFVCFKDIKFRGENIKIQIWDSSGQEKYKLLIPSYIRNSSLIFIIYDVTKRSSFDNVPKWINFTRLYESNVIILCGNKIDLKRKVEKIEGEQLAKKEKLTFFECSSKTS